MDKLAVNTPLDELEHLGDLVAIPSPKYPIGTRVSPANLLDSDSRYYMKIILRQMIKRKRTILTRLKNQGYLKEMRGNKMLPFHKEQLMALVDMVRKADSIEVAGHAPEGMHVSGTVSNQCYLKSGQCHSGIEFKTYLLFRRVVDGNKLVYLHPEPILLECYIKNLLVR